MFVRKLLTAVCLLSASLFASAQENAQAWQNVLQRAKGETVYFNAWGGDESINRYLTWTAQQVKDRYGITLKIVPLVDTADAVRRIETESAAGKTRSGSVDLLWVNGENFAKLKKQGLLREGWAQQLPNWQYVDTRKPVQTDFSLPTDGAESPWGAAQFTLIADRLAMPKPLDNPQDLLAYAQAHPGKLSYPRPPDFTGTTFLKQLLLALSDNPAAFNRAPEQTDAEKLTAPLWAYLDRLHPWLWHKGKSFPASPGALDRMLADGEVAMSMNFNPLHAQNMTVTGKFPPGIYSFGFKQGMIGNVHFLAIAKNAAHPDGAMAVADFLLSPAAQIRKADVHYWGDPTVLDSAKLTGKAQQALLAVLPPDTRVPVLSEPNAGWVDWLNAAWTKRYGAQ